MGTPGVPLRDPVDPLFRSVLGQDRGLRGSQGQPRICTRFRLERTVRSRTRRAHRRGEGEGVGVRQGKVGEYLLTGSTCRRTSQPL